MEIKSKCTPIPILNNCSIPKVLVMYLFVFTAKVDMIENTEITQTAKYKPFRVISIGDSSANPIATRNALMSLNSETLSNSLNFCNDRPNIVPFLLISNRNYC